MNGRCPSEAARPQRGFTLIELMIVVAIVGILASVAIPAYQDYTVRAKVTEGLAAASAVKASISDYYLANNSFPSDNVQAGLGAAASYASPHVQSVSVGAGGIVEVAFNALGGTVVVGQTLRLTPTASVGGAVSWACASGSTLPARYRPVSCR